MSLDYEHSRIRNLALVCILVPLLAVPLSGCAEPTPTPEPVTLILAHQDARAESYKALVQGFMASHPYITIKLVRPGAPGADVFANQPFELSQSVEQKSILSLEPFIQQDQSFDLSDFYPGTTELFVKNGQLWGLPVEVDPLVMYYNQDLFDQYGVSYPHIGWTWDDFLADALAIRDEDAGIFGYVPTLDTYDPLLFIYEHGGRVLDDLQNPTRTTFDDPLTVDALEWYVNLMYESNVAPTPEQVRKAFGGTGFAVYRGIMQGKAGMWAGLLSQRGGSSRTVKWNMRWGMVPLPRDAKAVTGTLVHGYFISAETQHPDACWELLGYLSQHPRSSLMPARKSLAESEAYEQQVGSEVAATARVCMAGEVLMVGDLAAFGPALELFAKAVDDAIHRRFTPAEALTRAQRAAESLAP